MAGREVELVLDARLTVGECPRWHAVGRALHFVDVPARTLHRWDPASGERRSRTFDAQCACFAFRTGGGLVDAGFVLGLESGFALIDSFDGPVRPFGEQVEAGRPWSRLNDGRTDPQGRFWAGAMDTSKAHRDGRLHRLDPDGTVTTWADGASTSNGAAFSPDGRTFYYSDTPEHRLDAFAFDGGTGAVGDRRTFHQWPHGNGRPDGGSTDEAGFYWSALYAGGRVARLSPAGEVVEEVAIPAPKPTMIAFGGDDRRTAYVTTAREGLTEAELAAFPGSGGVFSFRVDVPGVAETPFAG